MASAARYHADEVSEAISGAHSDRDLFVVESWRRCVDRHGLDPFKPNPAYIVPSTKLIEHQQKSERLIRIARSGVETLFRQVAGQNYVLLLCDFQGVTVDFFGDPSFEDELRRAGLYLGADWSENLAGTCGVGSCIATGEAITVHQSDHFDVHHTPLSCTAAPIFDPEGKLAAVLDISLLRSPSPKVSQSLALNLVKASARRIEMANLMADSRRTWVLRFSQFPEFLDVDPDAAVSLDDGGNIAGMTQTATRLLAESGGLSWRRPDQILGRPVTDFFDFTLDGLARLTRAHPAEQRHVRLRNGSLVFAHAIPPQNEWLFPSVKPDQLPRELSTICGNDPDLRGMMGHVQKTAKTLMPIVITGECGTGKSRLAAAIHGVDGRSGPFLTMRCASLNGSAFNDAYQKLSNMLLANGDGKCAAGARNGTIVLEEISDLDMDAQAKLEALIEDGCLLLRSERFASEARCRVIATTSKDLQVLKDLGRFRAGLFFRLYGPYFRLPALRDRADLDELLNRILRQRAAAYPYSVRLSQIARMELKSRKWEGNFHELIATIDTALLRSESHVIDLPDLPGSRTIGEQAFEDEIVEKDSLIRLLAASDWNISRVARHLDVDRSTIHRRMNRLGIRRPN